jgi:hypothetical protein
LLLTEPLSLFLFPLIYFRASIAPWIESFIHYFFLTHFFSTYNS